MTTISQIFAVPSEMIRAVARGYFNGLVLLGPAGIGKTYNTEQVLKQEKRPYQYERGCKTPLALYKNLYYNRNNLILFDDTFGLLNDAKAATNILGALDTSKRRMLSWETSSKALEDVPPKFEFTGRIIVIANRLDKSLHRVDAALSRVLKYTFQPTHEELIAMMREIADKPKDGMGKAARHEVLDFLVANTSKDSELFDLRLQQKLEAIYQHCEGGLRWKVIAAALCREGMPRDEAAIYRDLSAKKMPVAEQVAEFRKQTGKSRATFFRTKQAVEMNNRK